VEKNFRKHVDGLPTGLGMFYVHTFISFPAAYTKICTY